MACAFDVAVVYSLAEGVVVALAQSTQTRQLVPVQGSFPTAPRLRVALAMN
jgi:hypothetical protein